MELNCEETVWAFDLGKGSVGEAVRQGTHLLRKESVLIPAEFAETRSAATCRRMWRTRQAHITAMRNWQRASGRSIRKGPKPHA